MAGPPGAPPASFGWTRGGMSFAARRPRSLRAVQPFAATTEPLQAFVLTDGRPLFLELLQKGNRISYGWTGSGQLWAECGQLMSFRVSGGKSFNARIVCLCLEARLRAATSLRRLFNIDILRIVAAERAVLPCHATPVLRRMCIRPISRER